MDLRSLPRRPYTQGITALQPLPRLSAELGGPELYIKRDDQTGLTLGGNKTRKLELLVADALLQGSDTLVTAGAVQSNHCRLTAAAAATEGLRCHLVIEERTQGAYADSASGNNLLWRLLGVDEVTCVPEGEDLNGAVRSVVDDLAARGHRGYGIPVGGSNALGAAGYITCALEILEQAAAGGLRIDRVVTASGSGGTQAGLLVGLNGSGVEVTGINVSRPKEAQEQLVFDLAQRTAGHVGAPSVSRDSVRCYDEFVGPGYGVATAGMVEAVRAVASAEAILLDPVYTGKAMAGLIDLCRRGVVGAHECVVFVHTGGAPALQAYAGALLARADD